MRALSTPHDKPWRHARAAGFTVLEALVVSALMAFGLTSAMRLSLEALAAAQHSRNVDIASGLAQDLAECWGLQTPRCQMMFLQNVPLFPLSTDPNLGFVRSWTVHHIPVKGRPAEQLQELQISVTWSDSAQGAQVAWLQRRASTPLWVER